MSKVVQYRLNLSRKENGQTKLQYIDHTKQAVLIGKSTSTLRRWDREGTLLAKRGKCYQRYYTDGDIASALNLESASKKGKPVVYYRISTHVQKADLEHQRQALETYTINAPF